MVVVVNYNSPVGNHAGLWAGALLSDPAGSYLAIRARDPAWRGPSLADYVRYQVEDGDRVFFYRFTLPETQFQIISAIACSTPVPPPHYFVAQRCKT